MEVAGKIKSPVPGRLEDNSPWLAEQTARWVELNGVVTSVNHKAGTIEVDVRTESELMRARLLPEGGPFPADLRNRRVRFRGVCRSAYTAEGKRVPGTLLAIEWTELPANEQGAQVSGGSLRPTDEAQPLPLLTTSEQVKRLTREEALRGYPVKIRGVVTCARPDFRSVVLQGATRGIYVDRFGTEHQTMPRVGDYWEVEGTSSPGDFAPFVTAQRSVHLGEGRLPEPVHPTWDQLLNGSLDTQLVELRGVITSANHDGVELLTRGGKMRPRSERRWRQ